MLIKKKNHCHLDCSNFIDFLIRLLVNKLDYHNVEGKGIFHFTLMITSK